MKFTLEVGEAEKHVVEFNFNQPAGHLVIRVDNQAVIKAARRFNEPVSEVFTIEVGSREKSAVRIEKHRKQLFGHRNIVYVDNRLARVVEGF